MTNNTARKPVPAYSASGVRLAPYSARDLFMMDPANGETGADRYRAWRAGESARPTYRWLTANELADRQEEIDAAADLASMAP